MTTEHDISEETRELLRKTKLTNSQISKSVAISGSWLYKFRNGDINDSGARRVHALHKFLLEAKNLMGEKP